VKGKLLVPEEAEAWGESSTARQQIQNQGYQASG